MMQFSRLQLLTVVAATMVALTPCESLSLSSFSQFHGNALQTVASPAHQITSGAASLTMRKQKASDRRTRRMQMGGDRIVQELIRDNLSQTITSSPMDSTGEWKYKKLKIVQAMREKTGGRGRSRRRAKLYNSLSSYHNNFFRLLTDEDEYQHEVGRTVAEAEKLI
jgi:hypothetical protein